MNPVELQTAIYNRLNDVSVTALLTDDYGMAAIFSEWAPQVTDAGDPAFFPFITFSFPSSLAFDDKLNAGQSSLVQIDIWARDNTVLVKTIAKIVNDRLHRQVLSIAGHITTQNEGMEFEIDPDGITRRGRLTFRVLALGDNVPAEVSDEDDW